MGWQSWDCRAGEKMHRKANKDKLQIVLWVLCVVYCYSCSGGGEGGLNLDSYVGGESVRIFSVELKGEIAALEMDLRYDPNETDASNISVSFLEPDLVPADTYIDYSVDEGGIVKVAVMNGLEKGLNGGLFRIKVAYSNYVDKVSQKSFHEDPHVVKALNTSFQRREDDVKCRWIE